MTFHPKAWLAWLAAASAVVLATGTPVVSATVLVAAAVAGAALAPTGAEGRTYALMLRIGLILIAVRVVLFGLTGHVGATTVATLPELRLPDALGGFAVGGRVTAEVLAEQASEGVRMAALLACAGVFLAVVETYRVVRLLPRFLHEAGLVVSIAIAFVPTLVRTAADVRDAQRLRGHRFRGLRSLRPLVVPVVAGAVERSFALAESMESRGYGRGGDAGARAEARARACVLAGLLAGAASGALLAAGRGHRAATTAALAAATIAIVAGLRALSRAVQRTRMRAERLDAWDGLLIAAAVLTFAAALAARALAAAHWTAYPAVVAPPVDARLVALALTPAAPVALATLRRVRLRRASAIAEGAPS